MALGALCGLGGADLVAILLFTLISSSPSLSLPRFCWLSVVIGAIAGGGGAGGCGGLGRVLTLLDLEAIL